MSSHWCCGSDEPAVAKAKKISFTSIFRPSPNTPVVDTENAQISRPRSKGEPISPCSDPVELSRFGADDDVGSSAAITRTSTFDEVKAKIKKHLSHEHSSRRHSRVSIGHSNEELERRAEVRRLRQERIRHELEKGDGRDADSLRSRQSARPLCEFADMGSPRNGPRDTLEFTFEDCAVTSEPSESKLSSSPSSPSRSLSRSGLPDMNESCCPKNRDTHLRGKSDAGRNPSPADLTPSGEPSASISLPAPGSASPESGSRPKLTADAENDFNIRHGSHAWDDQSALGVWLIAQDLTSTDDDTCQPKPTVTEGPSPMSEASPRHVGPHGIDSAMESSPSMLDALKSSGLSTSPQVRNTGMRLGSADQNSFASPASFEFEMSTSSVTNLTEAREYKGSSHYQSVMPSIDPSLDSSDANEYVLTEQDLENLEFSPILCT